MRYPDPFRERSAIRLYLSDLPEQEQYKKLAEIIVQAARMPPKSLSEARANFFVGLQEDLWLSRLHTRIEGPNMKRQFKTQWTFADIELDHSQREAFGQWLETTGPDLFDILPGVLEAGYKLSIVFKPERDAWIATLTGMPEAPYNANVSMSSFHQTAEEAIGLALYKHIVIAEYLDWAAIAKPATWG